MQFRDLSHYGLSYPQLANYLGLWSLWVVAWFGNAF